jgi:mono/diheme cytochrome c family protein
MNEDEGFSKRETLMRASRVVVGAVLLASAALLIQSSRAAAQEGATSRARDNYQSYCAKCHGDQGKGDGPGAAMLKPKPRDYTDCKTMKSKTDDQLFKTIKDGGDSVGLSADMQPFGGNLSDDEIHELVQYVRGFCKQP